jgi:hypothetical protein
MPVPLKLKIELTRCRSPNARAGWYYLGVPRTNIDEERREGRVRFLRFRARAAAPFEEDDAAS